MGIQIHPTFQYFLPHFWRNYYLATPLFVVLDAFFHISLRIPFLDNAPVLKYIYYLMIFCFGLLIRYVPSTAKAISLVECPVCVALNCVGFLVPLYWHDWSMEALAFAKDYYNWRTILNFAITGGLLCYWFHLAQFRLEPQGKAMSGYE